MLMLIGKTNLKTSFSPYIISNCRSRLLGFLYKSPGDFKKVISFPIHTKMGSDPLALPENLHGSKVIDKEAFNISLNLVALHVENNKIFKLVKHFKKYLLRAPRIKQVQDFDENYKRMLFNPKLVRKMSDLDDAALEICKKLDINENNFVDTTVNLTYDNFDHSSVLKAVLPKNEPALTSFSRIGHIIHVNIKPHLLDFKHIIGQVLLEKIIGTRTVVNRLNRTENVFRSIEMELLCGDDDYLVETKENGIKYKLDFSKVYWNPRLSEEHIRIVESLNYKDVLFDVFCGIGPFSLPAAKNFCTVYANDLNPESVKWLRENIKLNGISTDRIHTFNKDGSDFISNDLKENLILLYKDKLFKGKIVIVMNLPASALEFIKCFKGLIKSEMNDLNMDVVKNCLPLVHCYFFAEPNCDFKMMISEITDIDLSKVEYSIHNVRSVATTKDMIRFDVKLPLDYMVSNSSNLKNQYDNTGASWINEPKGKRIFLSD